MARRRFLILYRWLLEQGKPVLFFREKEELAGALEAEGIEVRGRLMERSGNDRGYLRLAEQYRGKRILHIGTDPVTDGIIPREYGMDSRMIRGFHPSYSLSGTGGNGWSGADREQLLEEIRRHDIISFDIFDTLIKRAVLYPKDVFEIVEARTGIRGFADCRYRIQTTRPRLSLDGFYRCLKEQCGYDDRTLEILRRAELQTESDVILPRSSMLEVFEYAKSLGKKTLLVSDMYLDVSWIRELLRKNGVTGYGEIYLSYQYGKLKQDGLFEEMIRRAEPGETILHIGDNRYSDCVCARKYGLDGFYVPSTLDLAKRNGYGPAVDLCRTLGERKALGLGIAMGFDDPFRQHRDELIADLVVAPLALGYLQWVCEELAGKGYDWFLFSSRDGWMLQDAYGRMRQLSGDRLPPGKYFHISRHAAFLTVMDDPELVRYLIHLPDHDADPPGLLLRQFCLPPDELLPYRGETAEEYCRMHAAQIRDAAGKYRENCRKYREREGIEGKTCAVMDFVAEGTGQMMLQRDMAGRLDGYYIGVPEYIFRYARNIRYYLDQDMMDYGTEMKLEVYFTSMEPAVDRFDEQGRPVFARETRDAGTLDRIRGIQDRVRDDLNRYLDTLYDAGDAVSRDLAFLLCRTIHGYGVDNHYFDDMSGRPIPAAP